MSPQSKHSFAVSLFAALLALATVGCGGRSGSSDGQGRAPVRERTLVFAAYTTPREAYAEITRAFVAKRRAEHGEAVTFRESYQGSGAMARAVIGGFDADVVALSLDQDVDAIREAGLITHDHHRGPFGGMVTHSVVVFAVRAGNPKGIRAWQDLARPDVEVLTPNVRTSGGAMWNVLGLWGAALRGHAGAPAGDTAGAEALLGRVLGRVAIMDRSGRDSMLTFERGVGDVAITYENEVLLGRTQGKTYEAVIPPSTIRIDNPIAIVDRNVDRHGTRDLAEAFLAFVTSDEAQRIFARFGYRSVSPAVAAETSSRFPAPADQFTVADLGGWEALDRAVFADGAAYDRASSGQRR